MRFQGIPNLRWHRRTANISRFNEGKACDAVIRRIEAREQSVREDLHSPEAVGHAAPVELVCSTGGRLFAFEHTGIEPFTDQIQMEIDSRRLFEPIKNRFDGKPRAESDQVRA